MLVSSGAFANNIITGTCENPSSPEIARLVKQELALEDNNEFEKALEIERKLSELEPQNECAANSMAGIYGKLGKFDEEIIWAKRAIGINPKFMKAYINQGNAQASLGNLNEARVSFTKAHELEPKNPLPVYSIGVLFENENKFEEAAKSYQSSIELDPNFENGYFNLAAMKANMGKFDEARSLLKKLLKINPNSVDAKNMMKQFPK